MFLTWCKLYEWVVIPMVLMNTPAVLVQMMNDLFIDFLDKGVVVLLDAILIYSMTMEEHFELLEKVITSLCKQVYTTS